MVESISIIVYPLSIVVFDGIAGKLWYQAPGLDIYVSGNVSQAREHSVHYHAVEQTVQRHIPAMALRDVCPRRSPHKPKVGPEQKRMFE